MRGIVPSRTKARTAPDTSDLPHVTASTLFLMPAESLQTQLDAITSRTRSLVPPERLATTDAAIQELLASGVESSILPPGVPAPAFQLFDTRGKLVRSADLLALGPVVLNFFRGRWCPYCMTELEAWQAAYPDVRSRSAIVIGISPQLARQNDFTAQQHGITFPLVSDPGCALAKQFGIAYTVPEPLRDQYRSTFINLPFINGEHGESTWSLPLPATFVIGPSSRQGGSAVVLFSEAHADHRVRPDPQSVLSAIPSRRATDAAK